MSRLTRKLSFVLVWLGLASLLVAHITRGTHFHSHAKQHTHAEAVSDSDQDSAAGIRGADSSVYLCSCESHESTQSHSDDTSNSNDSNDEEHPCSTCILLKNNLGQVFTFDLCIECSMAVEYLVFSEPANACRLNQRPRGRSPPIC